MIQAFGKISVPTPGTLVRATVNETNPAEVLVCHGYMFEADPANTGKVYIGVLGMNKTTRVGVLAILAVPTANSFPTFSCALTTARNGLRLEEIYVDADNAGEGAILSVLIT